MALRDHDNGHHSRGANCRQASGVLNQFKKSTMINKEIQLKAMSESIEARDRKIMKMAQEETHDPRERAAKIICEKVKELEKPFVTSPTTKKIELMIKRLKFIRAAYDLQTVGEDRGVIIDVEVTEIIEELRIINLEIEALEKEAAK